MSLKIILDQMNANRANAEATVNTEPASTYGARLGLKRAATETMKRLRLDYRNELMKTVSFIIVTGSAREGFSLLASGDNFSCFQADSDAFYKELVSRIDQSLLKRENVRNLFNVVGNVLEDKMNELDVGSYPMLRFDDRYNSGVNTAEDLSLLVRRAVNDQVGSEVVGINAVHSILDEAIKKDHSSQITPVLLTVEDDRFALDLEKNLKRLTPRVFTVIAGRATKDLRTVKDAVSLKDITEETVGEALTTIRNKVLL